MIFLIIINSVKNKRLASIKKIVLQILRCIPLSQHVSLEVVLGRTVGDALFDTYEG